MGGKEKGEGREGGRNDTSENTVCGFIASGLRNQRSTRQMQYYRCIY
jgi:hypothetical protein